MRTALDGPKWMGGLGELVGSVENAEALYGPEWTARGSMRGSGYGGVRRL